MECSAQRWNLSENGIRWNVAFRWNLLLLLSVFIFCFLDALHQSYKQKAYLIHTLPKIIKSGLKDVFIAQCLVEMVL